MRHLASLVPVLAVALLGACGVVGGDAPEPDPTPAAASTPPTVPQPPPGEVEGTPTVGSDLPPGLRQEPAVQKAVADAARRLKVPESRIDIAAWSAVTWDDGSMGCPRPGQAYTQATVDGWLLLLRTDRSLLAYHAGPDGVLTHCADPKGTYTIRAG